MPSPISCGFCRAACSAPLSSSANGTPAISPRKAATRGRPRRGRRGARPAAISLRRFSSQRLAVLDAGGAPHGAPEHPERRARAQRVADAEQHLGALARGAATHSTSSCRRRDLPAPAGPVTSTALAIDSDGGAGEQVGQHRHLAPAPHELADLAEQVALDLEHVALAAQEAPAAVAVDLEARVEQARPPCRRAGSRPAPCSAAGACRCRSPRRRPTRPRSGPGRSRPPAPTSGNAARTRSAQRAARAAWSVDLPASGSVTTIEPSGSACTRAPCALASSVSSASMHRHRRDRRRARCSRRRRRQRRRCAPSARATCGRRWPTARRARRRRCAARWSVSAACRAVAAAPAPTSVIGPSSSSASMHRRHVGAGAAPDPWPACARPARRAPAGTRGTSSRTRGASCSRILASSADASSASNTGAPGQALEQHAAEREDVGAGGDVALAAHQLGRHVAGRADDRARCA